MSEEMATLIAKRFIQRRDAKAIQYSHGGYTPVTDGDEENPKRLPWMMDDIRAHLARERTYGHYLIDQDNMTKLFAFDIDLEPNREAKGNIPAHQGYWCQLPTVEELPENCTDEQWASLVKTHPFDAREAWLDRAHPSRDWTKMQLRTMVERISRVVSEEFGLPTVSAYSGAKGVHVYAFTGTIDAAQAREAAELTLQLVGGIELARGKNFFRTTDQSPLRGFPNLSIEVFPKQANLDGKDLGNLMRLPLGRNQKTMDPTFFIDQRAPMTHLVPHPDPLELLRSGRPWM